MARTTLRHPALALSVVAALGAGIAAPAATAASTPSPQVSQRGLLGDLLGGVLTPITGTLLPAQVTEIVTALTDTVDGLVPTQVADLLDVLTLDQLTQVVKPETILPLLQGLVPTLTSLSEPGATPTTPEISGVLDQLTAILKAGVPGDPAGQAALGGILDQVTGLLGLPGVRGLPVVGDLVTVLEGVVSQLPDPLKTPVQALITAAAGTPKTGATVTDPTLAALLALLTGTKAPAATPSAAAAPAKPPAKAKAAKVVRAKITSVKLSKNRRTLTVRVTCPTTASAACRIAPKATVAGKTLRLSGTRSPKRGRVAALKGRVAASTVRKLRVRGGTVVVRVRTTGSTAGAVSKTVRVRRAAR